ncbi:NUDIX hydrolase [Bauldia sp.]|uniref:NUDIX hydrolase n=1 Tax=Bauldia sp. TaxID=2575872 RepID=UPI003BA94E0F
MGGAPIVIAAAMLIDRRGRMLLVRKHGTAAFMQPGGKVEPDETPADALVREVAEEVGIVLDPSTLSQHGVQRAPAANEPGATVVAHLFGTRVNVAATPKREIAEVAWVDPDAPGDLPLAPLTRDRVLPMARHLTALLGAAA